MGRIINQHRRRAHPRVPERPGTYAQEGGPSQVRRHPLDCGSTGTAEPNRKRRGLGSFQILKCDCQLLDSALEFMQFPKDKLEQRKRALQTRRHTSIVEQRSLSSVNAHFVLIVCCCPVSPSDRHQCHDSFSAILVFHDMRPIPRRINASRSARQRGDTVISGLVGIDSATRTAAPPDA